MQAVVECEPLRTYRGKARARRLTGALPVLAQDMASLAPRWFGAALPQMVETRFGPCELRQGDVQAVATGDHLCAEGEIGRTSFTISLPKSAFPAITARMGACLDAGEIDPFVQAVALEHAFGPMIAAIEASSERAVTVHRVLPRPAREVSGLPVQLDLGAGEEITAFLSMPAGDLDRLLPVSCPVTAAACASRAQISVVLSAGAMWISMARLAEWKVGDVIVFAAGKAPRDAMICIAGGAVAQVRPDGGSLVVLTPFQRPRSPNQERSKAMAQAESSDQPETRQPPAGPGKLDDVVMMVSFDLGQRHMTVEELNRITVGTVFEIGSLTDDHARISVNGTTIGSARLVQIEDRLGVQIVSLQLSDA